MNITIEKLLNNKGDNYIFPFFWQHGESEEVLREYMKVIDESSIKAVCVESRPHPDFCGEKWWKDMDVILDEARKRKMKVWILDDSHFPTGFANGAMADQPDELCRQSICCRIYEPEEGTQLEIDSEQLMHPDPFQNSMIENYVIGNQHRTFHDDRLLGLWAVKFSDPENPGGPDGFSSGNSADRINLVPMIKGNRLCWTVPSGRWKIYALHLSRNQGFHRSYINMMDRKSCRVLIDAVYEPHYEHYGNDFGKTIAGFFSDEPELGNGHLYDMDDPFGSEKDYPWSRELEAELRSRLGNDYTFWLALLWETGADRNAAARVRYCFMDAVTGLVKENFSEQIGNWCRNHGVQYIGHLIEDDNHHTRTGCSLGHYYRGLWGQDMSGIDDIGGQVFPQGEDVSYNKGVFQHRDGEFYHYMLGKLGSSAAAIEPRKHGNSMCEIFGNYGWSEGVRLEKYLADHFLVRGINHYVPHAFSPKEFPDPDCPPHFYAHGHNPQYRHFGCLMAYMNRVCELISGGFHIAPVAVIYHAEGDWTGDHMTSDKVGHILADAQIEYDYIPQDVFLQPDDFHTVIRGNTLQVNTQSYSAVIVPYTQYVTSAFARSVSLMESSGIPVIFAGGYPDGVCDLLSAGSDHSTEKSCTRTMEVLKEHSHCVSPENLIGFLRDNHIPEISIEPSDSRIRYLHYKRSDGASIWMFVNEGTETYCGKVRFQADPSVSYCYDAWDNCIRPARTDGGSLLVKIEPMKSVIYVRDPDSEEEEIAGKQKYCLCDLETAPNDGGKCSPEKTEISMKSLWKRSICSPTSYPEFRDSSFISLPDRLAEEEPQFSGFVRYENSFEACRDARIYLEISDAYEGLEVFLNGQSLGIQIVPVYRYDLTGHLKDGDNTVCIEVATTLEREMSGIPDQFGRTTEAKGLSGITGDVRLWKIQ